MRQRRFKNSLRQHSIEVLEDRQLLASDLAGGVDVASSGAYLSRAVPVATLDASQVIDPVGGSREAADGQLDIEVIPGLQLRSNPEAMAAVRRAAAQWETQLFDPITVSIEIDFGATDAGVLGFAIPTEVILPYSEVRAAMQTDGLREADDSIVQRLPSADSIEFALPAGTEFQGDISIAKANAKAIGLRSRELDDLLGVADGGIVISNSIAFDFDNSDGVGSGQIDFETVVVHEIGHVLGFLSSVDRFAINATPATIAPTPLDLFRFRGIAGPDNPRIPAAFETIRREMRPSTPAVIDFVLEDGWELPTQQFPVELGEPANIVPNSPFGYQASHWQDSDLLGETIGVLVPTIPFQRVVPISNVDLRAMDLIGYDILPPNETPAVPELNSDAITTEESRVVIDVLANDRNADIPFQLSTFQVVEPPVIGTVEFDPATGLVVYRAPLGQGDDLDLFTYTIANQQGIFGEPAVVEVSITGVGQAPVAIDDFVLTRQNQAVTFNPLANDIDNGSLTLGNISIVSGPANGSIVITNEGLRYEPNSDFIGSDSFNYSILDDEGLRAEGLVEVTVGATLIPPVVPGQSLTLLQRSDINGDQYLSAIDALLVINYLNRQSRGAADISLDETHDVSGDGYVTALDALMVVNALNRDLSAEAIGIPPIDLLEDDDEDENQLGDSI